MINRAGYVLLAVWVILISGMLGSKCAGDDTKTISEIAIVGNVNISRDAILATIQEKPGVAFDRAVMATDKRAVDAMGFFSVVNIKSDETPTGIKLTIEVVENPKITSVVIKDNTVVPTADILAQLRSQPGQVYNSNTFDKDTIAVRDIYRKKGYVAYVSTEADIDASSGVLTIPVVEVRIGRIRFEGLKKTKPFVFEREMKLKPGAVLNEYMLDRDLTKIYELDYLDVEKEQKVSRTPTPDREGYVDLGIPVTEKKTGQLSVGLGYSSYQKVVGRFEVSEKNFQGKGLGLDGLYEVSGTGRGASYELGYYNPWWRKDHTSLSTRFYNKEVFRFSSSAFGVTNNLNDQYSERRKGGTVGLSKPITDKLRGFITLRSEAVSTYIPPGFDTNNVLPYTQQNGRVSSIAFRGAWDTRDFSLDPAFGGYRSFTIEPGFSKLEGGSSRMFTKAEIDLRKFISKGGPKRDRKEKRRVIALRLQGNWASGQLPIWEQFFLGGAERLRGYREDRFWGNKMVLGTVEYRVPLPIGLGGVVFADYGDAWGSKGLAANPEYPQTNTFRGHLGYGLGVRVNTPIGNIRLDYGFGDEGSRTHFSIGQAF